MVDDVLCFCLTRFSNSFCSCGGSGGGPGRLKPPERRSGVIESRRRDVLAASIVGRLESGSVASAVRVSMMCRAAVVDGNGGKVRKRCVRTVNLEGCGGGELQKSIGRLGAAYVSLFQRVDSESVGVRRSASAWHYSTARDLIHPFLPLRAHSGAQSTHDSGHLTP